MLLEMLPPGTRWEENPDVREDFGEKKIGRRDELGLDANRTREKLLLDPQGKKD